MTALFSHVSYLDSELLDKLAGIVNRTRVPELGGRPVSLRNKFIKDTTIYKKKPSTEPWKAPHQASGPAPELSSEPISLHSRPSGYPWF